MSDPRSWPIVEVVDPSFTRGHHTIWACVDPDELWYVIRAKIIPDGAFGQIATDIKAERGYLPHAPALAIMDQRGGAHVMNKETNESWFDRFAREGLRYVPSTDVPMQALHDWLRPIYRPSQNRPIPKLRFTAQVAQMKEGPIWALERFIWSPDSTKMRQYKQKEKDFVDCLRYLAGYPGLSYQRLKGSVNASAPSTLAASYSRTTQSQSASVGLRGLRTSQPRPSYRRTTSRRPAGGYW